MVARNNTTVITTKSGTKVYVVGTRRDKEKRDSAGDRFVNIYNRNFTEQEQRRVGNILYDFNNKHPDSGSIDRNKQWVAATGSFVGKHAEEMNPRHEKMIDMQFRPEVQRDETVITHELIHAKKFMLGIRGNKHNERKVDFEMVGRVSPSGVKHLQHGYYFHPSGNASLAKRRFSSKKKEEIVRQGVYADRILLTGSLSKSITGVTAEKRTNSLFRKSFFFKRSF